MARAKKIGKYWVKGFYTPTLLDRGDVAGGSVTGGTGETNAIVYITISSTGNATDAGDLTHAWSANYDAGCSNGSGDKGICFQGHDGTWQYDSINQWTISTGSSASDVGDMLEELGERMGGASNGTRDRGLIGGNTSSNSIEYITISTGGNGQDFGDMTDERGRGPTISNDTQDRVCFCQGKEGGTYKNIIDYVTAYTLGDATDLCDATSSKMGGAGCSNGTDNRGIIGSGYAKTNQIQYFTLNSTSNSADFGDLLDGDRRYYMPGLDNKTNQRGVIAGGTNYEIGGRDNVIQYITINSAGNATDFGDLDEARNNGIAVSNS